MRRLVVLAAVGALLTGCSSTHSPDAAPAPSTSVSVPASTPAATPTPSARPPDPVPIVFPRDDAPHDRLTEWWYYTGHLVAVDGRHFGFEAVIFRAERGSVPTTWASHLALTDEAGNRFLYAQRSQVGGPVALQQRGLGGPTGFALSVTGFDPSDPSSLLQAPWTLVGGGGRDRITAALSPKEAATAGGSFGLALDLQSEKPAALHGANGWIDFGPAGSSYYYSRTRMAISGSLALDGATLAVTGAGWFDHQWGDFISVGGGGWDWFAVELADGSDLTLSLVRAVDGTFPLVYGTYVDKAGGTTHLAADAFTVRSTGTWTSPKTGATYPAGWRIEIPGQGIVIALAPTVADQELDTRPSTGVVYWEGSQRVTATRSGQPVAGEAYVELTGYATAKP